MINKTYIIAEIGINHNGCLDTCKKLIDVAAVAGCDAVKFQKRNPDVCVPEHQKGVMRDTPWGEMTYLNYKKKIEFEHDEYNHISNYCKSRDIAWSASPWDLDSLEFLKKYHVPWIKIPSAMLTNEDLVSNSARWCFANKKRLIISTGMSTKKEIQSAYQWIWDIAAQTKRELMLQFFMKNNVVVMHCNSTYPAPIDELNLAAIKTIKENFYCMPGYSGHEFRLGTTVAAVYMGAEYIERHITLDRSMWGTDQLSSVEPQGLMKLVSGIRELERAYGDGAISVTESEKLVRKKLRG